MREYKLSKKRKEKLAFHIEQNDLFSTLATIINLIRDHQKTLEGRKLLYLTLLKLKEELLFLQEELVIYKKKFRKSSQNNLNYFD